MHCQESGQTVDSTQYPDADQGGDGMAAERWPKRMKDLLRTDGNANAVPEDAPGHWQKMLPERFPGRRRLVPRETVPVADLGCGQSAQDAQACEPQALGLKTHDLAPLDRRSTDRREADRRKAHRRAADGSDADELSIGCNDARAGGDQDRRATAWITDLQAENTSLPAPATEQELCLPSWLCGEKATWVIA